MGQSAEIHRKPAPLIPATIVLVVVLASSCRDATAPELGITVAVASLTGPSYFADSLGVQHVRCDLTLEARNYGTQSAAWMDATVAFYTANDSTKGFALDTVPAETNRSSWGAASIVPNVPQTAHWWLTGTVPFSVKIRFAYQTFSAPGNSNVVSASCEPLIAAGPPPTITTLRSQPDTLLEPGDTLHLTYDATITLGLWQSVIRVTGACDTTLRLPEHVQYAVAHEVALVMPAACSLGVPVSVSATAFDVRLQETSRLLTLPPLVDHKAPVLSGAVRTPYSSWASASGFAGYLFTGDAIALNVTATDNHALHGIYWEIQPAGLRDSVLLSGSTAVRSV